MADSIIPDVYFLPSNFAEIGYEPVTQFPEEVQRNYRSLYADGLCMVWWVMTAISVVGFLGALIARNDVLGGGLTGKQNFEDKKRNSDEVGHSKEQV